VWIDPQRSSKISTVVDFVAVKAQTIHKDQQIFRGCPLAHKSRAGAMRWPINARYQQRAKRLLLIWLTQHTPMGCD
jgi:hypothetical protein